MHGSACLRMPHRRNSTVFAPAPAGALAREKAGRSAAPAVGRRLTRFEIGPEHVAMVDVRHPGRRKHAQAPAFGDDREPLLPKQAELPPLPLTQRLLRPEPAIARNDAVPGQKIGLLGASCDRM